MFGFFYTFGLGISAGLILIIYALYYFMTKNFGYWKKKGVTFIKPEIPFGTMQEQAMGKMDAGRIYQRWYTIYKEQGLKYVGAFFLNQPTLILIDLDLCKHILAKDFHHFASRDMAPVSHEYITKHLFALEGQEWKDMRTKLTPTFTSGKMKSMFTLMERCVEQLQEHIDNEALKIGEFQVKNLIARFTTDIIATCAFGLEVNSIKDKENEFFKAGQTIFVVKSINFLKYLYYKFFPKTSQVIRINFYPPSLSEFFKKTISDTIDYRKNNNIVRNDFVDLLLKVKENRSLDDHDIHAETKAVSKDDVHERLTLEEMTAQAFIFFAAGFETAASTTSFCLYELAKNSEVQEKLRREIDDVLSDHGGKITYQAVQDMTYMDQVMNETLRMYASLPYLTRVCTESYPVPGTDLVIDKDVRVLIPTYAIHHDPDIYPDPYTFDPDRFSEENVKTRHHYAFTPFGEGPRICIGMRFGKLQVKIGLVAILSKYEVSPAPDTPSQLEINPFNPVTTARHPYSLKITRRTDQSNEVAQEQLR